MWLLPLPYTANDVFMELQFLQQMSLTGSQTFMHHTRNSANLDI
jgi:hypothetical protein